MLLVLVLPQAEAHPICLWQIHSKGAEVYLLGSIHAVRRDVYPLPAPMEVAFRQAGTLVVEVDTNRLSPQRIARAMREKGTYQPPDTLDAHLSPATRSALAAWLKRRNIDPAALAGMKPWLVSLKLEMRELARLGYDPALGIDRHFLDEAALTRKPVEELETWEGQIDLLSSDPPAVQDLELRATLQELPHADAQIRALVAAWQRGDADGLWRLATSSSRRYPGLARQMRRLTTDRNRRMAVKIRGYLARGGNWLVVVGALHMGGPDGLVKLLGKDFRVVQESD